MNKTGAGLRAFFFGFLGAHHFYLGQYSYGIIYILFCWTLLPSVFSLFEAIEFWSMTEDEFNKRYKKSIS